MFESKITLKNGTPMQLARLKRLQSKMKEYRRMDLKNARERVKIAKMANKIISEFKLFWERQNSK